MNEQGTVETSNCKWCRDGNVPEWSPYVKFYMHRLPKLDRKCESQFSWNAPHEPPYEANLAPAPSQTIELDEPVASAPPNTVPAGSDLELAKKWISRDEYSEEKFHMADVDGLAAEFARVRKEQEEAVAVHIKSGALDGCQCEPCISVRELIAAPSGPAGSHTQQELISYTERELEVLQQLAEKRGLSVGAVLRQALRVYQLYVVSREFCSLCGHAPHTSGDGCDTNGCDCSWDASEHVAIPRPLIVNTLNALAAPVPKEK